MFEGTDYSNEPSAADKKAFDDLVSGMYSGVGGAVDLGPEPRL